MLRGGVFILTVFALAGCGLFGGDRAYSPATLPFRATMVKGDDPRDISVRVADAAEASVEDVRESARFQATSYCLPTFGKSDAEWTEDAATGDWAFLRDGDDMIFTARCTAR